MPAVAPSPRRAIKLVPQQSEVGLGKGAITVGQIAATQPRKGVQGGEASAIRVDFEYGSFVIAASLCRAVERMTGKDEARHRTGTIEVERRIGTARRELVQHRKTCAIRVDLEYRSAA